MDSENRNTQNYKNPDQSRWEEKYSEEEVKSFGWYYPDLDPDLERALADLNIKSGHFLDLGTGPATQAMNLARLGFEVTATDISETAVERAKKISREERLTIEFLQDDILATKLSGEYDYIFDRGLFHIMPPEKRAPYVGIIDMLLKPGGGLFLKCFSHKEPGFAGPYCISPEDVRKNFESHFSIVSISETIYHGTRTPVPKALFCVMRKSGGDDI